MSLAEQESAVYRSTKEGFHLNKSNTHQVVYSETQTCCFIASFNQGHMPCFNQYRPHTKLRAALSN